MINIFLNLIWIIKFKSKLKKNTIILFLNIIQDFFFKYKIGNFFLDSDDYYLVVKSKI